jgi:amino acid transporter
VFVVSLSALGAALWLPIENLAQLTSFLLLLVFVAVNISLAIVRRKDTIITRKLRLSPTLVPWIGVVASGALIISQATAFF